MQPAAPHSPIPTTAICDGLILSSQCDEQISWRYWRPWLQQKGGKEVFPCPPLLASPPIASFWVSHVMGDKLEVIGDSGRNGEKCPFCYRLVSGIHSLGKGGMKIWHSTKLGAPGDPLGSPSGWVTPDVPPAACILPHASPPSS